MATPRRRKTFTVSKGNAFVGSVLGDHLSDTSDAKLAELTQHMEDHFAAEETGRNQGGKATGDQVPHSVRPRRVCNERSCPSLAVPGGSKCLQHRRLKGHQRRAGPR